MRGGQAGRGGQPALRRAAVEEDIEPARQAVDVAVARCTRPAARSVTLHNPTPYPRCYISPAPAQGCILHMQLAP